MNSLGLHLDGADKLHLKDVANDWLKVGTMLVVSRLLSGQSLNARGWQMESLYTLLGFTAYNVVVRNVVDTSAAGMYQPVADDLLKVATMLVVSRLLARGSLTDQSWLLGALATLVGFAVYDLVVSQYISGYQFTSRGDVAAAIDDAAKVGTMLATSRLLTNEVLPVVRGASRVPLSDVYNRDWLRSSAYTLAGFAAYELVTSKLVPALL